MKVFKNMASNKDIVKSINNKTRLRNKIFLLYNQNKVNFFYNLQKCTFVNDVKQKIIKK